MTIDDFQNKLRDRWREMDMEDVSFIGSELEKYDPEHYEAIYTEFRRSYQYNTPPRVAHIVKAIKELGLKKSFKSIQQPFAYVCTNCRTVYMGKVDSIDAYACPECMCRERGVIINPDMSFGKVKTVQPMCLCGWSGYYGGDETESEGIDRKCPNFGDYRAYGPMCDKFRHRDRIEAECRDCACSSCCDLYRFEQDTLEDTTIHNSIKQKRIDDYFKKHNERIKNKA